MKSRILLLASKALGLRVLELVLAEAPKALAGVATMDDSSDSRTAFAGLRALASARQVPLGITERSAELARFSTEVGALMALVVGWYRLIPQNLLDAFPDGVYGVHFSALPRYRGGSPLVWQMINGERSAGVSLFRFTGGMDDGPIIGQGQVPIGAEEYIGDVLTRAENKALDIIAESLPGLLTGRVKGRPQDESEASYCVMRRPDDGRIDWARPAGKVFDFIRAQSRPYPGAFSMLGPSRVTIWKAEPLPSPVYGPPGRIVGFFGTEPAVVCGNGTALRLRRFETEGHDVDVSVLRAGASFC